MGAFEAKNPNFARDLRGLIENMPITGSTIVATSSASSSMATGKRTDSLASARRPFQENLKGGETIKWKARRIVAAAVICAIAGPMPARGQVSGTQQTAATGTSTQQAPPGQTQQPAQIPSASR